MIHHYFKNQLIWFWMLVFLLRTSVGWTQTTQPPQLNFTLTSNETGTTKSYIARQSILLTNGFRYAASGTKTFIARIDPNVIITLPSGTILLPNDTLQKPDGTKIAPDGSQTKPDGTYITPEGTVYKVNGDVLNPNGTKLDISLVKPEVWFKTVAVSPDINGNYKWKDFSPNNVSLLNYSTNGPATEYMVARESVMYYNFNPAIDLTAGNVSKEIRIGKSNLVQATVMGVWGTKVEQNNTDRFIFALNGRKNESVIFSKSKIFSSIGSGKSDLPYGSETVKNLLCAANSNISANQARESSLRIASYYQSNMPNTTLWGEQQKANISLGANFQSPNTNNNSSFNEALNNFEGFKGYTPELLVFPRVLQPVERSIFETYLAIKYGASMDKSYYSANGKIIWNYNTNSTYNHRIFGCGREDVLAFNQNMATTSYQESPYFSDTYDSYQANSANTQSAFNRLLVMGCSSETPLNNGEYLLVGDDNNAITNTGTKPGYITMPRNWLVNINSGRTIRNWLELSCFTLLASDFASRKNEMYMLVTRGGQTIEYLTTYFDTSRSKIIFNNVDLKNGDSFTFGYKNMSGAKEIDNQTDPDYGFKNDIRIYHKDPADRSNITVRVETARPSTAVVTVYDMSGRRMDCIALPEGCEARYADLHIEMRGMYIVKVITNDKEYTKKVMVN